jgi:hypothetical protein
MAAISTSMYSAVTQEPEIDSDSKDIAVKLRVVLLKIQSDWSGDSKESAITAAMEFGKLVASRTLDPEATGDE